MPSSFPGATIIVGSSDTASVTAIQQRLNAIGCGPITVDGTFGAETFAAIETFQTRSVTSSGQPLTIDGKVGPATWAALFGNASVPAPAAPTPLLTQVIAVASSQVGVREQPLNSNRGPEVDVYIRTTGLDPVGNHYSWCACFVYWCFYTAAKNLGIANPAVKDAGVVDTWVKANNDPAARRILPAEAQAQPSLIVPGAIFLFRHSDGTGHMGLIESVQSGILTTIEGNTNDNGSSDGIGVFRRTARKLSDPNLGFILYS